MSTSDRDISPDAEDFGHSFITVPCGRCDYKFQYPEGTPWNIVNDMVNGHWSVCPGSISASVAKSRHIPVDPRFAGAFSASRQEGREGSSSNDENDADPHSKRNRKKNMMDESERKKKLEDDPWALEVTPISVRCGACTRLVSLDKRSRYYPGLWLKHREKCMEIKRLEAIEQEQGDKQESSSGQSPAKKRSKGKDAAVSTPPQSPRSSDFKGKGAQETAEIARSLSVTSAGSSEVASQQGPSEKSRHTSEAKDVSVRGSVYPEDSGGSKLAGKRRRSASSDSSSETTEDETRNAPFSTDESVVDSYLHNSGKYRHATWRELSSNFRHSYDGVWKLNVVRC